MGYEFKNLKILNVLAQLKILPHQNHIIQFKFKYNH